MGVLSLMFSLLLCISLFVINTEGLWKNPSFSSNYDLTTWNLQNSWGENSQSFVNDPKDSSTKVLRILYEKGSYSGTKSKKRGSGFYASPLNSGKTCLKLQYSVYFKSPFDFVRGGKLPGLWGGSTACSGGGNTASCFTTRLMWRKDGDGEVYAYLPDRQRSDFCDGSDVICNFNYGHSLGRGDWRFPVGQWIHIEQWVKLNTVGSEDGYVQVKINGVRKYKKEKLVFRTSNSITMKGFYFSTFFGGSTEDWATPNDAYTYFKDFKIYDC